MNTLKQTIRPYKKYSFSKMLRLKLFFTVCKYETIINNIVKIYNASTYVLTTKGANNLIGWLYADILLAGSSVKELENQIQIQKQEKITCISGFIREGLLASEEKEAVKEVMDAHLGSIDALSKHDPENCIAIKISCFASKEGLAILNDLQKDLIEIEDFIHENGKDISALKSRLKFNGAKSNINENLIKTISETCFNNKKTKFNLNLYEFIINNSVVQKLFGDDLSQETIAYPKVIDERLNRVISHANSKKCSVLLDAEDSFYQRIMDNMIMHYLKIYNKNHCLILHTIQSYLKASPRAVDEFIVFMRENNLRLGMKLVKGAYLKIETKMALEGGYENPINNTIEITHEQFNHAVDTFFGVVKEGDKVISKNKH